jgi:hypothetical protein
MIRYRSLSDCTWRETAVTDRVRRRKPAARWRALHVAWRADCYTGWRANRDRLGAGHREVGLGRAATRGTEPGTFGHLAAAFRATHDKILLAH